MAAEAVEPEEAVPDATAAEPESVEETAPDDAATRAADADAAPSPPKEEAPSEGGL